MNPSTIRTQPATSEQPDSTETTCGQLKCPERPNFFPGQLLGDDDLRSLVTWVEDRLRLQRLRDVSGVIDGLVPSFKPAKPTVLKVSPGYAVNCCGDDIVACEEIPHDIREFCRNCDAEEEVVAYLVIYPCPKPFRPQIAKLSSCDEPVCKYSRVLETARVDLISELSDDCVNYVALAKVTMKNCKIESIEIIHEINHRPTTDSPAMLFEQPLSVIGASGRDVDLFAAKEITQIRQLFERGLTPDDRRVLSQESGVSDKNTKELVKKAALCRLPDITAHAVEFLISARVDSFAELATRDAEKLHETLCEETGFDGELVLVKRWITHAKTLDLSR